MVISCISNTQYSPSFKGICLSKGINAGVNIAKKSVRALSNAQRENLPTRALTKVLSGPEEIKKANKIVYAHTAIATGISASMAQVPYSDVVPLMANEALMASEICKGVYKLDLSDTFLKSIRTSGIGAGIGCIAFKMFSWIPGLGNGLNAGVAATTTIAVGKNLIKLCEEEQAKKLSMQKLNAVIKNLEKIKK